MKQPLLRGLGENYPEHIHHAAFSNGSKVFPGIMAGGPNREIRADKILSQNFKKGTPGAKCWVDHVDSYSSNENCITYSASIIPLSAYFRNQ
jgi:endoglucanase